MDDSAILGWLLLMATAAGAALLVRAARCTGAPVVGGVLAGILLGPTIFGRAWPQTYEGMFVGGQELRQARDDLHRRHGADRLVADRAGLDEQAMAELQDRHDRELASATAELETARRRHQRPLRWGTMAAVAAMLLLGGIGAMPRDGAPPSPGAVLSIGTWAAALPGATLLVVLTRFLGIPLAGSIMAAAAVAIGPYLLGEVDRQAADGAEVGGARLIETAGALSTVLAIAAAVVGLRMVGGAQSSLYVVPLMALPVGWGLQKAKKQKTKKQKPDCATDGEWSLVVVVRDLVVIPTVAAAVAVRLELFEDTAFWPLLVVLLLSGDGRWAGATIGALLTGGRRWLRTMRLVLGSMAAGPTQIAVTAIALQAGAITADLALALLAGAVLIEVSTPIHRAAARRLAETEQELERLRSGSD